MKLYSIKSKLIIIFTLLISAISIFIYIFFPSQLEKKAKKFISDKALSISEMTAFNVSSALFFKDYEVVEEAIKGARQNEDLVYIVILDDSGKVFTAFNEDKAVESNYSLVVPVGQISSDETVFKTITPILNNNLNIGKLYLGLDLKKLNNEVRNSRIIIAVVSLIIFFTGIIAVFAVSTFVTKPLSNMLKTVKRISNGDLTHRTDIRTRDEVGSLARSFNLMVNKLESAHTELGNMNLILEKRVEDRTQKLQNEINERKRVEHVLRESEERFRALAESTSDWIWEINADNVYTYCSPKIKDILGYEPEEVIGKTPFDLMLPEDAKRTAVNFGTIKESRKSFERLENTYLHQDNRMVVLETSGVPIFNVEGQFYGYRGIDRDITERKKAEEEKFKLEEQLFQAQKMESIGRLAGGIAHDFNNILTGIMGYAELLKMQFEDTSTTEGQAADVIFKGTERAADMTQQLLGFARGGKYNPVPLKINDVIIETIKVSEKIFEKNIQVKYEFEKNIDTIEADKNQMNQVLTNIIINAKDAMPMGGELIFKTANVYIDKESIVKNPEFKEGNYVKVEIADTGIGMPKEIKDHIFEPFYTTKGMVKGTGLGLATVYGIVKNHNGFIDCCSESGKGTIFTIHLPVSEKEIIEEKEDIKIIKGDKTILFVDDEEDVRNIAKEQLKSLGYKVILSSDGIEAVNIYKKERNVIDLILLDMIMPNLAGKETYREFKKINPDVKVLLISGFSQNSKAAEILKEGVIGFIQKPFKLHELSKIIHSALLK